MACASCFADSVRRAWIDVSCQGSLPLASVRNSHIRGWVKNRVQHMEPSTLAVIYNGIVVPLFNAAVADKRIGASPCVAVRLPEIPDARYYIARPDELHALTAALPARYRAIVYIAAGCGWRGGEIFGLEHDGMDFAAREIHVRHQVTVISGRTPYLAPPKTKTSRRTNDYFATVLIFGGANVKTVQLAMGHTTPTVTSNTYVGYGPDAVDQTRTLVDTALGCTRSVPA